MGNSDTVADTNWTTKNFMSSTTTLEVKFKTKVFQFELCSRYQDIPKRKSVERWMRYASYIHKFHTRRYNFVTRIVASNNYCTSHFNKLLILFGCSKIKIIQECKLRFSSIQWDFFFIVLLRISILYLRRFLPIPYSSHNPIEQNSISLCE